jgi:hypothetical protein
MNQALYAHMNNKRKREKKYYIKKSINQLLHCVMYSIVKIIFTTKQDCRFWTFFIQNLEGMK